jgi:hypothetical protein
MLTADRWDFKRKRAGLDGRKLKRRPKLTGLQLSNIENRGRIVLY